MSVLTSKISYGHALVVSGFTTNGIQVMHRMDDANYTWIGFYELYVIYLYMIKIMHILCNLYADYIYIYKDKIYAFFLHFLKVVSCFYVLCRVYANVM
jgi:hypothetical protein